MANLHSGAAVVRGCEKMGTVPAPTTTNADFKDLGEARSGLSPFFSQPLRARLSASCPPKRMKTGAFSAERLSSLASKSSHGRGKLNPNTLIPAVAAILWLVVTAAAHAQSARSLVQQGNEAYQNEEYSNALESYEQAAEQAPDSPHIWFNRGSALYKEGQYDKAMDAFEQAGLSSGNPGIEALSKFSQGNTSFRKGVTQQETDPQQALASVERGVQLYQDALKVDPGLNDARHNIEVARRMMQQLMERLKNQPPSPSQGQGKNQEQDQQDQEQQQDASEQLKDLIEKQKDAAEQSQSAAQQQERDKDSQQMKRKAEDLANQQQQLKEETEKLSEKMKSQQQQQRQQQQSPPAGQAQKNLEQAAQKQSEAEQQLKDENFDQAQASQKEAQKDLEKALQAMNGEPGDQQQQDQSQQSARNQPPGNEKQQQMQQDAEDILDKEKADRQQRQTGIAIRIVPVDKDW